MTSRYGILAIALLSAVLSATPVFSEDILVPVDDFPPWKITDGTAITGGIDIALTDHLLGKVGASPIYRLYPWKRCLMMMKNGSADLISGVIRKKERDDYLYYLQPPYKTISVKSFFVRKGTGAAYRQLSDFEHKHVGLLRGGKYFEAFENNPEIHKFEVNSQELGLRMVKVGRLDAFIITRETGDYLLFRNPDLGENLERARWSYDKRQDVFFAISRESPVFAKRHALERELRDMVNSGTAERIIEEYFQ